MLWRTLTTFRPDGTASHETTHSDGRVVITTSSLPTYRDGDAIPFILSPSRVPSPEWIEAATRQMRDIMTRLMVADDDADAILAELDHVQPSPADRISNTADHHAFAVARNKHANKALASQKRMTTDLDRLDAEAISDRDRKVRLEILEAVAAELEVPLPVILRARQRIT